MEGVGRKTEGPFGWLPAKDIPYSAGQVAEIYAPRGLAGWAIA